MRLASVGVLVAVLGFATAADLASGSRSRSAVVTTAADPQTTSSQSTSTAQTTTTTGQAGIRRHVVWTHPKLTLLFPPGWKFLFDDPRTHVVIPDEFSPNWVSFYALPRAVYDPKKDRRVMLHGNLLAWLQRHPFLRVGRIQHLKLGKFAATAVDGRVIRTQDRFCGDTLSAEPCVPITVDPNPEGRVSFALGPREIFRIIKVKTPGRSVVIEIGTFRKAQPFTGAAMRLLRTLQRG